MNIIDEYVEKAVVGFLGQCFFEAEYKGKNYLAIVSDRILLISKESISATSKLDYDQYLTYIQIDELDDLFILRMFATYKGNEYEVGRVSSKLKNLELLVRPGHEKEDELLGFVYDLWERTNSKQVTLEEITDIRVEKRSFYEDFIEGKKLEF